MEEKGLIKLAESLDLSRLEDECIILDDEKADDIYGGKFVCWANTHQFGIYCRFQDNRIILFSSLASFMPKAYEQEYCQCKVQPHSKGQ